MQMLEISVYILFLIIISLQCDANQEIHRQNETEMTIGNSPENQLGVNGGVDNITGKNKEEGTINETYSTQFINFDSKIFCSSDYLLYGEFCESDINLLPNSAYNPYFNNFGLGIHNLPIKNDEDRIDPVSDSESLPAALTESEEVSLLGSSPSDNHADFKTSPGRFYNFTPYEIPNSTAHFDHLPSVRPIISKAKKIIGNTNPGGLGFFSTNLEAMKNSGDTIASRVKNRNEAKQRISIVNSKMKKNRKIVLNKISEICTIQTQNFNKEAPCDPNSDFQAVTWHLKKLITPKFIKDLALTYMIVEFITSVKIRQENYSDENTALSQERMRYVTSTEIKLHLDLKKKEQFKIIINEIFMGFTDGIMKDNNFKAQSFYDVENFRPTLDLKLLERQKKQRKTKFGMKYILATKFEKIKKDSINFKFKLIQINSLHKRQITKGMFSNLEDFKDSDNILISLSIITRINNKQKFFNDEHVFDKFYDFNKLKKYENEMGHDLIVNNKIFKKINAFILTKKFNIDGKTISHPSPMKFSIKEKKSLLDLTQRLQKYLKQNYNILEDKDQKNCILKRPLSPTHSTRLDFERPFKMIKTYSRISNNAKITNLKSPNQFDRDSLFSIRYLNQEKKYIEFYVLKIYNYLRNNEGIKEKLNLLREKYLLELKNIKRKKTINICEKLHVIYCVFSALMKLIDNTLQDTKIINSINKDKNNPTGNKVLVTRDFCNIFRLLEFALPSLIKKYFRLYNILLLNCSIYIRYCDVTQAIEDIKHLDRINKLQIEKIFKIINDLGVPGDSNHNNLKDISKLELSVHILLTRISRIEFERCMATFLINEGNENFYLHENINK